MNIKNLIYKISYKKVFNEIYRIYLGDKDAPEVQEYDCKFYTAWNNLNKLKYEPSDDQDVEDSVIFIGDCIEDEKPFVDVCLLNKTKNEVYGIDFLPWENFIEKEIKTDLDLAPSTIIAHILWEITFWGWDSNTVQQIGENMIQEAEDIIKSNESL